MPPKIDAFSPPRVPPPRGPALSAGGAERITAVAAPDRLRLTDTARQLAEAERVALTAPDVDEPRVQRLRAAVSEGRYAVQAERVAAGLLALERDLNPGRHASP